MAAQAGYRHLARQYEDVDLFRTADLVREAMATPGWKFVEASIAEHERRMNDRLLNETCRDEEVPRLRGLIAGLRSMREAAESICLYAEEREQEARKTLERQNA